MTGMFFALAFLSAINPKLLGVDLLLIDNERPRRMFLCFLLGGMGLAVTIGLLDVFILQSDTLSTQGSASASVDLVVGIPLVAVGVCSQAAGCTAAARHRLRPGPHSSQRRTAGRSVSCASVFAGLYMAISGLVRQL